MKQLIAGAITIIVITGVCILFAHFKNTVELNEGISNHTAPPNDESMDDAESLNRIVYEEGFYYESLSEKVKKRITGVTFPSEFPEGFYEIPYDSLRYVRVMYCDFQGRVHDNGELIVHKDVAQDVVEIFHELYINEYPLHSVRLVDDFGGIDEKSMAANNTSAFNYRLLEEGPARLSWHCLGMAVDINPLYNPYVTETTLYPANAGDYVDRSRDFPGKIDENDLAYKLFTERGWVWGGDFLGTPDYQHFDKRNPEYDALRYRNDW